MQLATHEDDSTWTTLRPACHAKPLEDSEKGKHDSTNIFMEQRFWVYTWELSLPVTIKEL